MTKQEIEVIKALLNKIELLAQYLETQFYIEKVLMYKGFIVGITFAQSYSSLADLLALSKMLHSANRMQEAIEDVRDGKLNDSIRKIVQL